MDIDEQRQTERLEKLRNALPDELDETLDDVLGYLESGIEAARDEQVELHEQIDDMESALQAVEYWMHDVMVLGKTMSDPRAILRQVEDVL
jgi:hypothetical protein